MRVLIVDDNELNQKLLMKLFDKRGVLYVSAYNGQEAFNTLSNDKNFSLIFMDFNMPILNGLDATIKLKKAFDELPPIIGLSASVDDSFKDKCITAGMSDFVGKPFQFSEIFEMLDKYS